MSEYAITLGRLQMELEATLFDKGLTAREWREECLRVCTREGLPMKCFDYLADYLVKKYC